MIKPMAGRDRFRLPRMGLFPSVVEGVELDERTPEMDRAGGPLPGWCEQLRARVPLRQSSARL